MNEFISQKPSGSNGKFLRNFILIALALFLGLAATAWCLFDWLGDAIIHSKPEAIVPDIVGKSSVNALQVLSALKLSTVIDKYEFKESEPIGTVLSQTPASGTTVREGKSIRLTVSKGGESVFTPTLSGMSLRNAELLLRQNQLTLGEVTEGYSMRVEKGTVLSQDPKPETSVSKNTMVNVKVSVGAPPSGILMMPDFRQKDRETVYKWASKNDISVNYDEDPNSAYPHGTVFDQEPEPDTILEGDTKVYITVSAKNSAISAEGDYNIHYDVSATGSQRSIRIISIGKAGEREVFNGLRDPGSKIDISISKQDISKVRIFVNGILVEERLVK